MPLGRNQLGSIMSEIRKQFALSQVYINHSLRATTVHVLDAADIAGRHIMSVTGHKSESSLKTYTGYTSWLVGWLVFNVQRAIVQLYSGREHLTI